MNKLQIRKKMHEKRCKMTGREVSVKSDKIFAKICKSDILKYKNILVYSDFKNEVKTDRVIDYLLKNGAAVYLPVCSCNEHTFAPVRIYSSDFEHKFNKYGIAEPVADGNGDVQIDCALVPGIAFDEKCNRIGFGGGYYDRFLSDADIFKIGLCYDFQIVKEAEYGAFDVPMDTVISERRTIASKEGLIFTDI